MGLFSGCANQSGLLAQTSMTIPDGYTPYEDEIMGLALVLPTQEHTDWTIMYGPFDQSLDRGEYAPVDGSSCFFSPMVSGVPFFDILYYTESDWDGWMAEGKTPSEITGLAGTEEIGRSGGMVYVYCPYAPDDSAMDEATKAEYRRVLEMIPVIKESITLTYQPIYNAKALPAFQSEDLSGNTVDSKALFAANQLTMVNIWGTFCGPCIDEMPGLAEMSQNMPEGTAIVGLLTDATDQKRIDLAKTIVAETDVTYANILPTDTLLDYFNENIVGVPTTLFIDNAGNIIGSAVMGAKNAEGYLKELEKRLAQNDVS
jgi:thiol-disulfide isomerase/thioredoxin